MLGLVRKYCMSVRHKTNAYYEKLVYDYAEKRMTKNLFYDSCLNFELG